MLGRLIKLLLRPGLLWRQLRWAIAHAREDHEAALDRFNELRAYESRKGYRSPSDGPSAWDRAYRANLMMKTENFAQARTEFVSLTKDLKGGEDDKDRRVELYAHYWVAMLDTKPSQADYWAALAEAEGMPSKGILSLPLPSEQKDKFDQELDEIAQEIERELAEKNKG